MERKTEIGEHRGPEHTPSVLKVPVRLEEKKKRLCWPSLSTKREGPSSGEGGGNEGAGGSYGD